MKSIYILAVNKRRRLKKGHALEVYCIGANAYDISDGLSGQNLKEFRFLVNERTQYSSLSNFEKLANSPFNSDLLRSSGIIIVRGGGTACRANDG